jgi:hypothetical protein
MSRGSIPADAAGLAQEIRRLAYDVRRPHLFQERKRDLAAAVAGLAQARPCASCAVASLGHALDAARQSARAAQARAERAERLLASVRPRKRRSQRRAPAVDQLELWT